MENVNSQNVYYNGNNEYSYQMNIEEKKKKQEQDAKEFKSLGIIGLMYSAIFVVCLYDNLSGVTTLMWAAATVYYMYYVSKSFGGMWENLNTFVSLVIMLLGFSNFVTDNMHIILMNYMGIIALILVNMVLLFYNTKKLNISRHIALILEAVFGAIGEMNMPFTQMAAFARERKKKKNDKVTYVVIGIVIAIPVVIIIASILGSADEVFNKLLRDLEQFFSLAVIFDNIFGLAFMALVGYVAPYIYTINVKKKNIKIKEGKTGNNEPIIAIIVTTAISIVYLLFSGIQIYYLFMGNGTLPDGYTYAEYAREGFFQLLFVCVFNLIMVIVCIEFFRDNKILSVVLTIISVCTFVMIASSGYRMGMYIKEYGLTFTRVFVIWALIVITLVITGLLYQIYKKEFNLFRYATIVVSICFLILSFSHIDYFIARYNLNMYEQGLTVDWSNERYSYADYDYVVSLSADAAPVFAEYWDEISLYIEKSGMELKDYDWAYQYHEAYGEKYNKMTMRNFNLSRYIAREIMNNYK